MDSPTSPSDGDSPFSMPWKKSSYTHSGLPSSSSSGGGGSGHNNQSQRSHHSSYGSPTGDDYMVPSITAPGLVPMHPGRLNVDNFDDEDDDDDDDNNNVNRASNQQERIHQSVPPNRSNNDRFGDRLTASAKSVLDDRLDEDEDPQSPSFDQHNHYYTMQSRGWAVQEEDEDSDGQDYEAPPISASVQKKATTRMKSNAGSKPKPAPKKSASSMKSRRQRVDIDESASKGASNAGSVWSSAGRNRSANSFDDEELSEDVSPPATRRPTNTSKHSLFGKDGSILDQDVGAGVGSFTSTGGSETFNSTASSLDVQEFDEASSPNSSRNSSYNENDASMHTTSDKNASQQDEITELLDDVDSSRDFDDEASVTTNNSSFYNSSGAQAMQVHVPVQELKDAFDRCAIYDAKNEANKK
jgi:hypothetical protein